MIEAVEEVGSWGGVGLGVVGVANAALLADKYLVLLFTTTLPRSQMPLYHILLSAVPGPPGLARVAVSTCPYWRWEHVELVCPWVNPQPWVEQKILCTTLS